jgi:hypothetical protein
VEDRAKEISQKIIYERERGGRSKIRSSMTDKKEFQKARKKIKEANLCLLQLMPIFSFVPIFILFFFQYWSLNSGPPICYAGMLTT